ncbi:MAG: methyltransferase domain-containing protein [Sphingopyxis sp.]|uniref:methyltransferase regulatory domain-containing protein n=1 Tax=Sphingopyxis sp. TaxID=1908224 RepID=UPI003D80CCFD
MIDVAAAVEGCAVDRGLDGYVADSLYPSNFHAAFAPPNIDAMLAQAGIASPRGPARRRPFTMVDIGCGDGVGLILNAAAHPEGHFIGIDGNPDHIAHGRAVAARVGLSNIDLASHYFADARAALPAGIADYVQCQGVLAWVGEANRGHVLALSAQLLKPGGVLAVGYNCLPGWTPILAFQQMLRALAAGIDGTPGERFEGGLAALRETGLFDAGHWEWIDGLRDHLPADYFAHEYLNANWTPLWSGAVLDAAAAYGLVPAGQARPGRLRPDFAFKAAWRKTLAAIASPAARECAADLLTGTWFRTDLFLKGAGRALAPAERDRARLAGWWAATQPADAVHFEARTSAGTIRFDNDAARAIVRALAGGPQPLGAIEGIGSADLFNAIDALFMAGAVVPVDPPADVPLAAATHAALLAMGAGAVNGCVGRHGVARIARGALADLDAENRGRLGI